MTTSPIHSGIISRLPVEVRVTGARPLISGFLASARKFPDRPAIEVRGEALTYAQLLNRAARLSAALKRHTPSGGPPLTAVFGQRSATIYTGVLAALHRAHGYVPLNPAFPTDRTAQMLNRAGCRALIVDGDAAPQLDSLLSAVNTPLAIFLPEVHDVSTLAFTRSRHQFFSARDLEIPAADPIPASPNDVAYLLFTSGSTGIPKGVAVAQRNVTHFIDVMLERYAVTESDRFSQMFDLTFDLSVFDMFLCWEAGACLCVPARQDTLLPAAYINKSEITIWFSVPSTGVLMHRLRALEPGLYPNLRLSLFCGEALTADMTRAWTEAAPNSIVENLYGPTELTIACALYRWDPAHSPSECERGFVPIGHPYPGMTALIADENLHEVPPGEAGELLMSGPQVTLGYWNDPDKTAASFVTPPGRKEVFYRTGDMVRRPIGNAPMTYLGRVDHQIKVHGFRVELGEIESVLREAAGVNIAIAVGWPRSAGGGADGIVAFVQPTTVPAEQLIGAAAKRLPKYMVPKEIRQISEFPLNANGKVDRNALLAQLEQ